ncbi:FadR/GntR family transcriptional regulator [Amycolatopsis pithecellobii]|uniref:FCD domain-containing protein n=1 Tax=Amycolatopsis pithecellobii TaxID=664692 RepID=A0A6N7Z331_9PSEU|nr:FCD domain-containing protein [Amycolatopsis pithecellobii]MTD54440.1 FCD domain-containing protein [Amycolatopsis pithecellobii]
MSKDAGAKAGSRAEDVAARLEMEILRAGHPEGTRLGLRTELINRFEVSPGVMNEALRLLRDRELITVKPGPSGGVFTADQPPGVRLGALDLWFQGLTLPPLEIFESRMLLEEMFNNLALANSTPADHAEIERALQRMNVNAGDPRGFFESNVDFHRAIAKSTRVTVLTGIYDSLVTVLMGALVRAAWTTGHEQVVDHNLRVHGQIFEAIRAKDRKRLETAARLHRVDMVSLAQPEKSPVRRHELDAVGDDTRAG